MTGFVSGRLLTISADGDTSETFRLDAGDVTEVVEPGIAGSSRHEGRNAMKRLLVASLLALVLLAGSLAPPASASTRAAVSVSFFHSALDPWGEWVTVPALGVVWRPHDVGPGWQPYLVGYWSHTAYGWTWVSQDPWDPWPYHYGTWVFTTRYGWVWVPGTIWAPAWVTWYVTDGYIGWAPVSTGLMVSESGVTRVRASAPTRSVVFVPTRAFAVGDVRSARVGSSKASSLLRSAESVPSFAVVDGVVRTRGPSLARVERAAGARVRRADVSVARVAPSRLPDDVVRSRRRAAVVAPRVERDAARPARPSIERGPRNREMREGRPRNRPDRLGLRPSPIEAKPAHQGRAVPRVPPGAREARPAAKQPRELQQPERRPPGSRAPERPAPRKPDRDGKGRSGRGNG